MGLFKRKATDDQVRLKVTGMHCAHCEMNISRALGQVPGVKDASADKDGGTAVVSLDGDVDTGALIAAVEQAGYQAEPAD
jgi:copper chaperone CopZ